MGGGFACRGALDSQILWRISGPHGVTGGLAKTPRVPSRQRGGDGGRFRSRRESPFLPPGARSVLLHQLAGFLAQHRPQPGRAKLAGIDEALGHLEIAPHGPDRPAACRPGACSCRAGNQSGWSNQADDALEPGVRDIASPQRAVSSRLRIRPHHARQTESARGDRLRL